MLDNKLPQPSDRILAHIAGDTPEQAGDPERVRMLDNFPPGSIAVMVVLVPPACEGAQPTQLVKTDNSPTEALYALNIGMAIMLARVQDKEAKPQGRVLLPPGVILN